MNKNKHENSIENKHLKKKKKKTVKYQKDSCYFVCPFWCSAFYAFAGIYNKKHRNYNYG